ncbi:hypothetical protein TREES_T100005649 [Tupaia chinensis]|uniref:Uncharacterized protein n=1 Tax=Tupaia chinensis TaxID=246437 RepID=L9J9M7_TUPCH|nr:hypothetical protein TREES_T100005649 [Tupaia chinensis]
MRGLEIQRPVLWLDFSGPRGPGGLVRKGDRSVITSKVPEGKPATDLNPTPSSSNWQKTLQRPRMSGLAAPLHPLHSPGPAYDFRQSSGGWGRDGGGCRAVNVGESKPRALRGSHRV